MINFDKIKCKNISKVSIIVVIGMFLLILIIYIIPAMLENTTLKFYNYNTTLADMHISIANNLLMTFITFFYVLLTVALVTQSKEQVAQSKLEVAQSRKEQQIRDIENRLEKFYIPAEDIINGKLKQNHEQTINGWPPDNYIGLKDFRKYSYLADKETYGAYKTYIESNCKETKEITCQDKYTNKPKGFTVCEDYKSGCHFQYNKCSHNLNYCKYYNECPPKDQAGIIQDNTKCKYYIDLKNKIKQDIEDYKNELLELKNNRR